MDSNESTLRRLVLVSILVAAIALFASSCTTISGTTPDGTAFKYSRLFQDYETTANIERTSDTMRVSFETRTNSDPALEAIKAGIALGAAAAVAP